MMMVMAIFQLALGSSMAQYATFNHDESVMNQVTIQETGAGSFCPDFYYDVFQAFLSNHDGCIHEASGTLCREN